MVSTLLQGGVSSYFLNFKRAIAPFIKDAYLQKKENDEAEKMGRQPKQLVTFPTHQEVILQAMRDPNANSGTTLIIEPVKRKLIPEVPLPGPLIKKSLIKSVPIQKVQPQNMDQQSPIKTPKEVPMAEDKSTLEASQQQSEVLALEESEDISSDQGTKSAPESQPPKKKKRRSLCPSTLRHK